MGQFASWLKSPTGLHPAELAAQAHYRLVSIHPFVDGNGRTARLLMNLLLMQKGYPPAFIRTREGLAYLNGLEKAQLAGSLIEPAHPSHASRKESSTQGGGALNDYESLMYRIMDRSLDIYLKAAKGESPVQEARVTPSLLRIGALAKKARESTATLRHWTNEGLLNPEDHTESGYTLYPLEAAEKVKLIRELQGKRLSLSEIKRELEK
jgi:hypothetical protein